MESIVQAESDGKRAAAEPTSVYRYYDEIGVLLYVGITRQGMGRNVQHNGKAEWWPLVARQEVDHLPSRPAALQREKQLIQAHRPPFNKQHNPDHAEMRAAYLAYAIKFSASPLSTPLEVFHLVGKRVPLDIVEYEPRRLMLRTRLEHGPLASVFDWAADAQAITVRGHRRQYGSVAQIERTGPIVSMTCTLRSKGVQPEGGIASAVAQIRWGTKPQRAYLKQVLVTEGDLAGTPL